MSDADTSALVAMLRQIQCEPASFDTYSMASAAERAADAIETLARERDALRSALTASEKDAARYRWLRDQYRCMSPKMDGNHHWSPKMAAILRGPSVDAAIDAAMEKANG